VKGTYIYDLNDARILTSYDRAREIRNGVMPAPRMAIIYPNYLCNYDCAGCEYTEVNRREHNQMDLSRLLGLMDELREIGVDSVEFCGGGEPTLYPDLNKAIAHGRKLGFSIGLLTNGSNIRGELAETIARELSYVRISLDAATAGTYGKVKRPAGTDFNHVIADIKNLMRLRQRAKSQLLISIKFLVSRINAHEIPKVFDLAKRLRVDSLQFKALRQSADALTKAQQQRVAKQINSLRKAHPELKVLGGVDKLTAPCQCWLTPLQTMIDARGDVFLCCYYLHRRARHRIGNINRQTFREIWEGFRHRRAINAIRPSECNLFDCRFINYMKIIEPILNDSRHQTDFI
jgi:radical SAM protein with 4Fe4S-binding SPASM domain